MHDETPERSSRLPEVTPLHTRDVCNRRTPRLILRLLSPSTLWSLVWVGWWVGVYSLYTVGVAGHVTSVRLFDYDAHAVAGCARAHGFDKRVAVLHLGSAHHVPDAHRNPPCESIAAARSAVQMMGRKKKVEEEEVDDDDSYVEEAEEDRYQMVDAMTTSLGKDEELKPFPGPAVRMEEDAPEDGQTVFCHFGLFASGTMPSEGLQEQYYAWLQQGDIPGNASLMGPHYLLSGENDDDESMLALADELDDDDIARLDAEEEAAAAAAEAEASEDEAGDEVDGEIAVDEAPPLALESPIEMESFGAQFVLGHLTLARAPSWEVAHAWVETDPVNVLGGYGTAAQLHQWLRVRRRSSECSADGRDDSVVRRSLPR